MSYQQVTRFAITAGALLSGTSLEFVNIFAVVAGTYYPGTMHALVTRFTIHTGTFLSWHLARISQHVRTNCTNVFILVLCTHS